MFLVQTSGHRPRHLVQANVGSTNPMTETLSHLQGDPQGESPRIEIVELSPDDWQELQELKLRSLDAEPVAFEDPAPAKEKYARREEAEWRDILSGKMSRGQAGGSVNVFAKLDGELVGMVSAIVPEGKRDATIQHMYVDPQYRGWRIGKELFRALIDKLKANGNIEKAELQVVASQVPAVEMYKSFGFEERGRKPLHRGGQDYEEIEMELLFRDPGVKSD